jgi:uncharacterized protein
MIQRKIEKNIQNKLFKGKVIILFGARQVGKTTVLKKVASSLQDVLWLNADTIEVQTLFEQPSSNRFQSIIKNNKVLILDEAQNIKDIGLKIKVITDELKDVQLIATGSSAFDLANQVNEPLTGRKYEFQMFPVSFGEMVKHHGLMEELSQLNRRLIYGYYPDIVINQNEERDLLKLLADSYLFKDILIWNKIKKSDRIIKLLQALSFQVGNQVSYNELGKIVGLNSETVESYISLLEKAFIIFRVGTFSRNLRSELKKTRKVYFVDNGIRNAVISSYNPIELRNDKGALWENFLMSERKKILSYDNIYAKSYFWRTHAQQEVDYIEEHNGNITAFEFKWGHKKAVISKTFSRSYPNAKTKIITPENVEEFLLSSNSDSQ